MEFDESRVYTAVNAEELKIGDKVYVGNNPDDLEYDVKNERDIAYIVEIYPRNFTARFRVKYRGKEMYDDYCLAYLVERAEEKKYRPYESIDELISAWKNKTGVTARANTMPLIWLKRLSDCDIRCITTFSLSDSSVVLGGSIYTMGELLESYTFLDGSPCGKEIED